MLVIFIRVFIQAYKTPVLNVAMKETTSESALLTPYCVTYNSCREGILCIFSLTVPARTLYVAQTMFWQPETAHAMFLPAKMDAK